MNPYDLLMYMSFALVATVSSTWYWWLRLKALERIITKSGITEEQIEQLLDGRATMELNNTTKGDL